MHVGKICFTTYYYLLITFDRFCDHHHGSFTKVIREYRKLPNCICGTTQRYNECLIYSMWSQNIALYTVKNR